MAYELEEKGDGTYRWNPIVGEDYPIYSLSHPHCVSNYGTPRAIYVGPKDGKYIFLMEVSGKVFAYSSHVNTPAVWQSDGPGDPCFPLVKVSFECKVEDGPEKDFIMERLREHKSKIQPKTQDADRQLEVRL